jgi:hypothetical protein
MKIGNGLLVGGLSLAATAAAAQPGFGHNPSPREAGISCRDFRLNSNGSWSRVESDAFRSKRSVYSGARRNFQDSTPRDYKLWR